MLSYEISLQFHQVEIGTYLCGKHTYYKQQEESQRPEKPLQGHENEIVLVSDEKQQRKKGQKRWITKRVFDQIKDVLFYHHMSEMIK